MTTSTIERTHESVSAELKALVEARKKASGAQKGILTRQIKQLQAELGEFQQEQVDAILAAEPEPQPDPQPPVDPRVMGLALANTENVGQGQPVSGKPQVEKTTLAELEAQIAQAIHEAGQEPTRERIVEHGNPVAAEGRLKFYGPQKFGNGEWASDAVVKRIGKAVEALKGGEQS